MNDIEQTNRQINITNNPLSLTARHRRSQRQRISPSPELQLTELSRPSRSLTTTDSKSNQIFATASIVSPSSVDNSHYSSDQLNMTNKQLQAPTFVAQPKHHLSDSLTNPTGDNHVNSPDTSPSSSSSRKKNSSTSDLDPFERRKQAALAKAEAKLKKAQRLHRTAKHSVERNLSELLRVTTIPGILNESKITNKAYEKRIHTLQETAKELEKKIANYQADVARIQVGDIPSRYTSSKDILNNIKDKVSNVNSKHPSTNDVSTPITNEHSISSNNLEPDNHPVQHHLPPTSMNHNIGTGNNNQNFLSLSQTSNTLEVIRSSPSGSISSGIGTSQFYSDSNYGHSYDGDKSNRKHDVIIPGDISGIHEIDKSPSTKRRFTDDSNIEFSDRISDHSSDDRFVSYNTSKRNTMTTIEYHQLMLKIDFMQKTIERYETKMNEMHKEIDSFVMINDSQRQQNERINNELSDFTVLYQNEMPAMKTELKKLEEKLLWNFNEYWSEMVEKLDKLDTRTTKIEQTQAHSLETEENTHRLISKFVNILLTVFAIILLLLSTIKNLVQSRVHAVILLILVFTWIAIHYLPENYFQSPYFNNLTNIFKRTS